MAGRTFTDPLALAADMRREIGAFCVDLARDVTVELREATPVDTTHARGNWVPSIGDPADVVTGSREAPDDSAQIAGLAEIGRYHVGQGDLYVGNGVEYIQLLNEGSSPQAPPDFVGDVVESVAARG